MRTIVMVDRFLVEDMSQDHGHVFEETLGFFSTIRLAKHCMLRDIERQRKEYPEEWEPDSRTLRRYYLTRYPLDRFPRFRVRFLHLDVFDSEGRRIGSPPGGKRVWLGRTAETCRFHLGDFVGFRNGDEWRIGVVKGLPPDPELVARMGSKFDAWEEDVYLVDFWDRDDLDLSDHDACYNGADHDHIPECMLEKITVPLDSRLQEMLKARYDW